MMNGLNKMMQERSEKQFLQAPTVPPVISGVFGHVWMFLFLHQSDQRPFGSMRSLWGDSGV